MKKEVRLTLLLAILAAGCANVREQGGFTVESYGANAPAKPPGCAIEVLRKQPTRPYMALGQIRAHLTEVPNTGAVPLTFPKACELGADAVIVERDQVLNEFEHKLVVVTPIRWRVETAEPEPETETTTAP